MFKSIRLQLRMFPSSYKYLGVTLLQIINYVRNSIDFSNETRCHLKSSIILQFLKALCPSSIDIIPRGKAAAIDPSPFNAKFIQRFLKAMEIIRLFLLCPRFYCKYSHVYISAKAHNLQ